jgi:uncharacterized membrane protein
MVEVSTSNENTTVRLSPNRSATWQQTKVLMIFFTCFVISIATAWSLVGAWLILPFAGVEVSALALVMYLVSRATYQWEEVQIDNESITISSSKGSALTLTKHHTYLFFVEDKENRRIPKLVFTTPDAKCEIGSFLNEQDKMRLASHLSDVGIIICKNKWWTS